MEKLLLALLLSPLPFLIELAIDGYRVLKLNRTDNHGVTGSIRFLFIILVGFANPTVDWWQGSLLAFAFHYLLFDYAFNRYIIDQPIWYLGNNFFDRLHKKMTGELVLFLRLALFGTAIKFYVDPLIY